MPFPSLLSLIPLLLGLLLSASAHSGQLSDIQYVIQISVDGVNADMPETKMAATPPGAMPRWEL